MDCDRESYEEFVARSPQGTLFCSAWWLDAVAPNDYRILTVQRGGEILAAWPIVLKHSRVGGQMITMAPLTPWLGISYHPKRSSKLARQLSSIKDLTIDLVQQLPEFDALEARFHRSFDYWAPLVLSTVICQVSEVYVCWV